jgi:hypothetical protein
MITQNIHRGVYFCSFRLHNKDVTNLFVENDCNVIISINLSFNGSTKRRVNTDDTESVRTDTILNQFHSLVAISAPQVFTFKRSLCQNSAIPSPPSSSYLPIYEYRTDNDLIYKYRSSSLTVPSYET